MLAVAWELYGALARQPAAVSDVQRDASTRCCDGIANGALPARALASLQVLLIGYAIGIALAGVLTALAITTRIGTDLLETLTAMFNPLPAIALLPLALIWFGLGDGSLIFVLVHSVLWAVALNTHRRLPRRVADTLRMVGRNYGLTGCATSRRSSSRRRSRASSPASRSAGPSPGAR